MRLIAISNPYTNHSFHMGDIPNLRADDNGGNSFPLSAR
jgi:hypothetical protein